MAGSLRWKDGAWRLRVSAGFDQSGRRQVRHCTVHEPNTREGRRKANLALAAFTLEVEHTRGQARAALTLGEYCESWIKRRSPDWAPSTRNTEIPVLRRHVLDHIGGRRLDELHRRDIAGLLAKLTELGHSPSVVNHARRVLHRALAEAVDLELIPTNPVTGVKGPAVPKSSTTIPTDAELDAIVAEVGDSQLMAVVLLDACLGARRGELCALRWPDIDFDAKTVTIARAISIGPPGEGRVERQTKTDKVRVVAIDDATVAELKAHRVRRIEKCMAAGAAMDPDGFVFVSDLDPTGTTAVHPVWITRQFKAARDAAGVVATVKFGSVRKYVATMLLRDGIDVNNAARRLGHRPETLLAHYAQAVPAADRDAADLLARRRRRSS